MTRIADLIQIHYDHTLIGDSAMADVLLLDTAETENLVMVAKTPRDVATYGKPQLDPFDPDLTAPERSRIAGVQDAYDTGYGTLALIGSALRCGVLVDHTQRRLAYDENRTGVIKRDRYSFQAEVDAVIAALASL